MDTKTRQAIDQAMQHIIDGSTMLDKQVKDGHIEVDEYYITRINLLETAYKIVEEYLS